MARRRALRPTRWQKPLRLDEPIIAGRIWHLHDYRLWAYSRDWEWPTGKAAVACCAGRHGLAAPVRGCSCGIYASKLDHFSLSAADMELLRRGGGRLPSNGVVYGRVALWGHFVEAERGYKAQFAYPIELFVNGKKRAQKLRQAYGVEVWAAFDPFERAVPESTFPTASGLAEWVGTNVPISAGMDPPKPKRPSDAAYEQAYIQFMRDYKGRGK